MILDDEWPLCHGAVAQAEPEPEWEGKDMWEVVSSAALPVRAETYTAGCYYDIVVSI